MPMIEAKVTMQLPAEKRDVLKAEFGKAISIIGKPESYLMINLIDNQDLYFGGKKLDKGAYVEVKVLGSVDGGASDKMTAKLCEILDSVVVHELCHRKHMNHSKEFYEEIYRVFPEYDRCNKWLKENGGVYMKRVQ